MPVTRALERWFGGEAFLSAWEEPRGSPAMSRELSRGRHTALR